MRFRVDRAIARKPFKIPESVLVVIHTPELEVLLIERADQPGFWQSVTGSKDASTSRCDETAVREVAEETGIASARAGVPREPACATGACATSTRSTRSGGTATRRA